MEFDFQTGPNWSTKNNKASQNSLFIDREGENPHICLLVFKIFTVNNKYSGFRKDEELEIQGTMCGYCKPRACSSPGLQHDCDLKKPRWCERPKVAAHRHISSSVTELERFWLEEWDNLLKSRCIKLLET